MEDLFKKIRCFSYLLVVSVAFLAACDTLEPDDFQDPMLVESGNKQVLLIPESVAIFELSSTVQTSVPVTITVSKEPVKGILENIGLGLFKYEPNDDFTSGTDFAVYTLMNDTIEVGKDTVEFRYLNEMRASDCYLIAVQDNIEESSLNTLTIDVLSNDIICNSLGNIEAVNIIIEPTCGTAVIQNNKIEYTPSENYICEDWLVYQICTANSCALGYVSLQIGEEVEPVDKISDLPLEDDRINFNPDSAEFITYDILQNDGLAYTTTPIELKIITSPSFGTAEISTDNMLLYYPLSDNQESYVDELEYEACINNECGQAKVTIEVIYVECTIEAVDDEFNLSDLNANDQSEYTLNVLANDQLCGLNDARIEILKDPSAGTIALTNNTITYTPGSANIEQDNFEYKICDANGNCSTAQVTIRN